MKTQQTLPLTLVETRAARLQRLLSGELSKRVQPASALTFTARAARAARTRAQAGHEGALKGDKNVQKCVSKNDGSFRRFHLDYCLPEVIVDLTFFTLPLGTGEV